MVLGLEHIIMEHIRLVLDRCAAFSTMQAALISVYCAVVGQPMVSNVMQGYNACCLAYGQTGAGKTHTMQGEMGVGASGDPNPLRGLAPRVFEKVFEV